MLYVICNEMISIDRVIRKKTESKLNKNYHCNKFDQIVKIIYQGISTLFVNRIYMIFHL